MFGKKDTKILECKLLSDNNIIRRVKNNKTLLENKDTWMGGWIHMQTVVQ